jgi:enamine deaminase RidA (YjgF/YER057c/UK114 family)
VLIVDVDARDQAIVDACAALLVEGFARNWPGAWDDLAAGRDEVRECAAEGWIARAALDEDGTVVGAGDYEAQARAALKNLRTALEAAGSSFEHVVKSTVYVASADRADLVRVWRVVEESFAPARPPSTLLGVAALGYDGQLVEIEAVAVRS